jgi:hypothetical protein
MATLTVEGRSKNVSADPGREPVARALDDRPAQQAHTVAVPLTRPETIDADVVDVDETVAPYRSTSHNPMSSVRIGVTSTGCFGVHQRPRIELGRIQCVEELDRTATDSSVRCTRFSRRGISQRTHC